MQTLQAAQGDSLELDIERGELQLPKPQRQSSIKE